MAAKSALAVLLAVLVWTRLSGINSPFWNDEAFSAFYFIDRGTWEILFGFYNPNSHVLFSLLSHLATVLFGRGEAVYRMASVVPAIVAVGVFVWWMWHRLGPWVAVASAYFLVLNTLHLDLAQQARGYGVAAHALSPPEGPFGTDWMMARERDAITGAGLPRTCRDRAR